MITNSGLHVKRVYSSSDVRGIPKRDAASIPGRYRFTRGIYPEMYRTRLCRKKVVGPNVYSGKETCRIKLHKIDSKTVRTQIARAKAVKRRRNRSKVKQSLERLKCAPDCEENVMPFIIEAVKAKATTGEISDLMREVFGEFRPKTLHNS